MGGIKMGEPIKIIEVPDIPEDLNLEKSLLIPEGPMLKDAIRVEGTQTGFSREPALDQNTMKISPDLKNNPGVRYFDLSEAGPSQGSRKNFMGDNGAQNRKVQVVVERVTQILETQGVLFSIGAEVIRKIHDTMAHYKVNEFGQRNGNAPREAFTAIAEEIAADLIFSRNGGAVWREDVGTDENALSLREAATSEIDSMLDEVLNDRRSPLRSTPWLAAKVRDRLRSKILQDLESYLSQMPEISTLDELQARGFFAGRKSKILDFIDQVSRDWTLLERD